jgi:NhaA family Na+:H+ antiporter
MVKTTNSIQLRTVSKFFGEFVKSQQFGGVLLLACTFFSILSSNTSVGEHYVHFWHQQIGFNLNSQPFFQSIEFVINDGLMSIFFLLVGVEIKRELISGELSSVQKAMLPMSAALGGMIVPAVIYFVINKGLPTADGWAIPMATDIAFALGILGLVGKKVPVSLKIFITALAVVDDLGAIVVIGIFYSSGINFVYAIMSVALIVILLIFNKMKYSNALLYFIPGIFLWYTIHHTGVHATLSGVLLAFTLPMHEKNGSPSLMAKAEHLLHTPVNFVVMPLFALANTCIELNTDMPDVMPIHMIVGIAAGLCIGKPVGILLFSYITVKMKWADLPRGIDWIDLTGAGLLGGIGFTMSVFITLLAFDSPDIVKISKVTIVIASLIVGVAGFFWLRVSLRKVTL